MEQYKLLAECFLPYAAMRPFSMCTTVGLTKMTTT